MTTTKEEKLSISNICDGAAIEAFEEELQKVLDDIVDPNTRATAVREVTLKIAIKPDDNRSIGEIIMRCDSKLSPSKEVRSTCFIGNKGHRGEAHELITGQTSLFNNNVIPIDQKSAEED